MNVRTVVTCALALVFLAVSGKVAIAQDQSRNSNGQGNDQRDGRDNGWRDGQYDGRQSADWNRQRHTRFNDRDRQVTRSWYQQNRRYQGRGWRNQDRLSPAMQNRLRVGRPLDYQLRRQMHPLPAGLWMQYGAAPRGYQYVIIGGNIVMLDPGYRVQDVFSLTLNF